MMHNPYNASEAARVYSDALRVHPLYDKRLTTLQGPEDNGNWLDKGLEILGVAEKKADNLELAIKALLVLGVISAGGVIYLVAKRR